MEYDIIKYIKYALFIQNILTNNHYLSRSVAVHIVYQRYVCVYLCVPFVWINSSCAQANTPHTFHHSPRVVQGQTSFFFQNLSLLVKLQCQYSKLNAVTLYKTHTSTHTVGLSFTLAWAQSQKNTHTNAHTKFPSVPSVCAVVMSAHHSR